MDVLTDVLTALELKGWLSERREVVLAFGLTLRPVQIASFTGATFFGDLGAPFDCTPPPGQAPLCRGHFAAVFDHSATPSTDGMTAYLAYWDAGAILLDMSNPSDLHMIGRTPYPTGSEGARAIRAPSLIDSGKLVSLSIWRPP